jgi:hypothetical protein
MNKIIIPIAAIGLLFLANKNSSAATGQAAKARTVGGYGGFGVGSAQPMRSSTLSNNYYRNQQGSTPNIWGQVGQTLGSFAKSAGLSSGIGSIGETVGSWAGGVSSGVAMDAANSAAFAAMPDYQIIAESAGLGLDAGAAAASVGEAAAGDFAIGVSMPYIAGAAAIDSYVFNGEVGQTVADAGNGLANSVADIFGW